MTLRSISTFALLLLLMAGPSPAAAQQAAAPDSAPRPATDPKPVSGPAPDVAPPAAPAMAPQAPAANTDDPDLDVNLAQPDFGLATLPTTARLPRYKMAFRMTHRFNEPMSDSGLGGLYGMDSGAMIGLELRAGLARGLQAIFYRTSDQTIQFSTQYDVLPQTGSRPLGIAVLASIEGTDNFQESYSPALGLILSRELGTRAAVYVEPTWVNNTNTLPKELIDDNSTMLLGLGARIRVLETTYIVGELVPRVTGFAPDRAQISFGIEKRAGGHLFQLTFANGIGSTWGQVARGAPEGTHWHLGFNLSRKFY